MKYPVTDVRSFKAEISVWTRPWADNVEDNFPDEITQDVPHPSPEPLLQLLSGKEVPEEHDEDDLPPLSLSESTTLSSSDWTKVDDERPVWSHAGKTIVRRSEWMVIIDETAEASGMPFRPTHPFEITLNSWDFLRCCPLHPRVDDLPPFVEVPLPLAPLRQRIITSLGKMREELQNERSRRVATADASTSTNPTQARLPRLWDEPPDMKAYLSRQKRRKFE
ncbi:hypothetical protein FRC06_005548 [Ceratobasidium sp. 370]|nr:hypothetical protein FRC06_005548 [Ceratobasidium sp. 370]